MKKYNLINNSLGWLIFIVAAVTYMLTLEPTASFWDCGEFIAQGYKLEVGHPPGNPIFMLAANFFTHFASDPSQVAVCVNAMSGLLSAGCILLLFWTITHLVRRLITKDDQHEYSWRQIALIMGSGVCGALAYAWSDTFWFSAVEAEVYAFSSFCTALTFWLILKWENRSNRPDSDRYLVAIAYVIGVSVAVHLLNLLCIPAIVLVVYYKKYKKTTAQGSIIALLISFAIIVLILFGLVPGFVEMAQYSELLFVNTLNMGFNSGVVAYTIVFVALLAWSLYAFHARRSLRQMRWSFLLVVFFSGMLFIGSSMLIPTVLTAALAVWLFYFCKKEMPVRILHNIVVCITMIFIGYSSYALILIRSNAQTPMDQNSPDNVFTLAGYLNREQYGKTPLFYGPTYSSPIYRDASNSAVAETKTKWVKEVKATDDAPDRYVEINDDFSTDYTYPSETKMFFPRLYDSMSKDKYVRAMGGIRTKTVTAEVSEAGDTQDVEIPTFSENIRYFLQYQLNYMYWRYFLWNFAGRQNDLQGNGEINRGNWISGIPLIDNARLGDQSLLPDDLKNNPGHNVFYMLPLLLGIIGLLWQAYSGKRGIEQFWVVFFMFFMTGIAIVLYLNQYPEQPRERDYAYAGSFYAFAIWIGMGVAGLCKILGRFIRKNVKLKVSVDDKKVVDYPGGKKSEIDTVSLVIALAFGLFVPLQMVSQTWDDHDRSGRYACRDFGKNYLSSVDPDGIIFTSGDNDTFPLWYAQEVEGYRTDVRVVNMSYLATDWYIAQMRRPSYESAPLPMQAKYDSYAYSNRAYGLLYSYDADGNPKFNNRDMRINALKAFDDYYRADRLGANGDAQFNYPNMFIPVDAAALVRNGVIPADKQDQASASIPLNLFDDPTISRSYYITSAKTMQLDIISSMIAGGWKRPAYFAITIPDEYYSYFQSGGHDYTSITGMAYALTPFDQTTVASIGSGYTDKAYRNITEKFVWGGLDKATPGHVPYYDEAARRMVQSNRIAIMEAVENLITEAASAKYIREHKDSINTVLDKPLSPRVTSDEFIADRYRKAAALLTLMDKKMPEFAVQTSFSIRESQAKAWYNIADATGNAQYRRNGNAIMSELIDRYTQYMRYYYGLDESLLSGLTSEDRYMLDQAGYLCLFKTMLDGDEAAARKKFDETKKTCGFNIYDGMLRAARQCESGDRHAIYNLYDSYVTLALVDADGLTKYLDGKDYLKSILQQISAAANEAAGN